MVGLLTLGLQMASASVLPSDKVYLSCIDAAQIPSLAEQLILPEELNGGLVWTVDELHNATQSQMPVTLNYAASRGQWEITITVGPEPDIAQLVKLLMPDAETVLFDDGRVTVFSDRSQYYGKREMGVFRITNTTSAAPFSEPNWPPLNNLEAGCSLSLEGLSAGIPKLQDADVLLYVPYNLGPMSVMYRHPDLRLPNLSTETLTRLPEVKTIVHPIAVVQVRQSPIEILRDDTMPERLQITDWKFALLHRKLRIPGAQMGVFTLDKSEPDLLAVVPIAKKIKKKPVNDRRIWRWLRRLAKKTGWTLIESEPFRGQLKRGDDILWVRAMEGELHMATQSDRLDSLSPDGQAWRVSDLVEDQPLSLSINLPQMMALAMGGLSQVQLGLAIDNNVVLAQLSSTSMNGQSGMRSLLAMAATRMPRNSTDGEIEPDAAQEVPMMLRSIAVWSHRKYAENGYFEAMEAYPRSLDSTVHQPFSPTEVASNGWQPDRAIVGRYWVEATADGNGYLIHGLLKQENGQNRHWVRDEQGKEWEMMETDNP